MTSEPGFYASLCIIVGTNNFSAQFIEIISHYKKIFFLNYSIVGTVEFLSLFCLLFIS